MPRLYVNGVPIGDDETALNLIPGPGVSAAVADQGDRLDISLGLAPKQQAATLTADASNSFYASQVIDLGQQIASFVLQATILSSEGGGETFGMSPGQLYPTITSADIPYAPATSPNGSAFSHQIAAAVVPATLAEGGGASTWMSVGDVAYLVEVSLRYLRIALVLMAPATSAVYEGPNQPSLTAAYTISYI